MAKSSAKDIEIARITADGAKSNSQLRTDISRLQAENKELAAMLGKARDEAKALSSAAVSLRNESGIHGSEIKSLKAELSEKVSGHALDLNRLKMSFAKERGSLQCEIDSLKKHLKGNCTYIELTSQRAQLDGNPLYSREYRQISIDHTVK